MAVPDKWLGRFPFWGGVDLGHAPFCEDKRPLGPTPPNKNINRVREVWEAQSFAGRDQPNVWVPPFYRGTKSIREGKDRPF